MSAAVAGAAIGGVFGSIVSAWSQHKTNQHNAALAYQSMDFSERMSSTQYQRGMADMRKAGLNPMLAYAQGGASAPTGDTIAAQNPLANIGQGVSSAMDALRLNKDLEQADVSMELLKAQKLVADTTIQTNVNTAKKLISETKTIDIHNLVIGEEAKAKIKHAKYDDLAAPSDAITRRLRDIVGVGASAKELVIQKTKKKLIP